MKRWNGAQEGLTRSNGLSEVADACVALYGLVSSQYCLGNETHVEVLALEEEEEQEQRQE